MSQQPWLIRNRKYLLISALAAFVSVAVIGVAYSVLGQEVPIWVVAPLFLIFIWGNGLYWWLKFYWSESSARQIDVDSVEARIGNGCMSFLFLAYGLIACLMTAGIVAQSIKGNG